MQLRQVATDATNAIRPNGLSHQGHSAPMAGRLAVARRDNLPWADDAEQPAERRAADLRQRDRHSTVWIRREMT